MSFSSIKNRVTFIELLSELSPIIVVVPPSSVSARARSGQIMNFKPVRLDYHIDKYRGN